MKSDGQKLYEMYTDLQLQMNNCGCDDWEGLEEEDRQVWEKLAAQVRW